MTPTLTGTAARFPDTAAAIAAHTGRDATALVHNGHAIGYDRLTAHAAALARRLGPHPGPVAVYASRTPATIAALLATWWSGGAHVPVDPAFPAARRAGMIRAAGCRTIVHTAPGQPDAEDLRVLDAGEPPTTALAPAPVPVGRDAPAYILFTSGSTGAPKPVVTSRGAIGVTVASLRDLFGITPGDRVLQFASLNWDTSFEEILPTLAAGATLVLDDETRTGSFPRFLRAVEARGVTVLDLPTAYWHELVHHLAEDDADLPPSVRLLVIGGEAAAPARLAEWRRRSSGRVRLLNTYGCTETTLITHAADLSAWTAGPVPIGRALPHVAERIGADGELHIGGPALATGYLGDAEATSARFTGEGGARYFHTGDRVARTSTGDLVHLGRLDAEIKIRGVRVDPAEVEAHITAHPGVAAAAVVGTAAAGRTILAAYVVPDAHTDPGALRRDLLAGLRRRVPAHLVPGRVTVVGELEHTTSGKVDRAATHRHYAPEGAREARR